MTASELVEALRTARKIGVDSLTKLQVVAYVAHNGPSKMVDMAIAFNLSTASMTGIVDKLEASGLAQRHDYPNDRRTFLIRLTEKGVEATNQIIKKA